MKVILDTDIGTDIDDAVALAYLLKQPECDLLGITTVTGEPERRASLADAICQSVGRGEIPIHVGTEDPLLIAQRQARANQAEALTDRWPHRDFSKYNTAITFLRDTIRAHPGEITLLTIGPLTNIGLLFALDPEIPGLLKQLMMMGGRFYPETHKGPVSEWNIQCDPHAAAKVFQSPVPRLTAVGLDVTLQCTMEADACRKRFAEVGGPLAPVADMAEVWFRHTSTLTFHDPLAAALLFQEDLCTVEPQQVEVDLTGMQTLAQTRLLPAAEAKPHHTAVSVDVPAFFEHYFAIVGA